MCVCVAGAASGIGPGDGSEDEQAEQQQSQHAAGGAADEPPLPPQHPQVRETTTVTPLPHGHSRMPDRLSADSHRQLFIEPTLFIQSDIQIMHTVRAADNQAVCFTVLTSSG